MAQAAIKCLSALLILSSCALAPEESEENQAKTTAYLQELNKVLERSIASESDDMPQTMKTNVRPLIGISEKQIRGFLRQEPRECDAYDVGRSVGCFHAGDIVYSFYSICNDCLGGGPELSLSFDRHRVCTRAKFLLSE